MIPPVARPRRRTLTITAALLGAMMVPMSSAEAAAGATAAAAAARGDARPIAYHQWDGDQQLRRGTLRGVEVTNGRLRLPDDARGSRRFGGQRYDRGTWISPWHSPGFGLTQLIPSWSAKTPRNSFIEVRVRGRDADGNRSSWDLMARWAADDQHLERTTRSGQSDDLGSVNVDTWNAASAAGMTSYQLRVTLLRAEGQQASPRVDTIGAVASRLPAGTPEPSRPGDVRGVVLDVPQYSQMIHQGHYPQWGNGGEAWCSPTSTSMVLGYYDALPRKKMYSWVPDGHPDPWVDLAARRTYDHAYDGTGNWPFNTAYAATRLGPKGSAFVTRLKNARQAEKFIEAGIPLVASISFGAGELSGAPISASNGHLLVVVGFDADGDVVVNDPAASSNAGVRRTYDRAQFERAWLTKSGGLVYVIHDRAHPLPTGPQPNW